MGAAALAMGLVACGGSEDPRNYTEPVANTGAQEAEAVRNAKEAARIGVIDDLYRQWQGDHLVFVGELEAAGANPAAIERPRDGDPVRSIDDLMERLDPQAYDPAIRTPIETWRDKCREYDRRLRELGNDPSKDPRTPLPLGNGS